MNTSTLQPRQSRARHINWGIIAPGRIAGKFAQDLLLASGARLHAVASRSLEKAAAFAERYSAPHAFGSYEALLDCPDLDVVYIASPHAFHCEHALLCLERGIAVLCEKPLAMNAGQVEKMIATARRKNTFLMEAMWTRFFPLMKQTIELVKSGAIGDLRTIRADFGFHSKDTPDGRTFSKALGGGSILDVGIYPVFLTLILMGKPEKITVHATHTATGVDESCSMTLHYAGNRMAQLYSSVVTQTAVEAWIYGTKGRIHLPSRFHHPKQLTYGDYYSAETTFHHPYPGNGYQFEIEEVMSCLRQDKKESEKMPLALSLELMEVLDEIVRLAGVTYE
jgi:predicted dehydrogenase